MDARTRKRLYAGGDYISLTDKERKIFKGVVEDLDERGLFHLSDAPVIAAYARNVMLARAASADVEKYGTLLRQTDKYRGEIIKENPAVGVMQRAQRAAEDSALKLGLTPAGRKKVRDVELPPASELDEWDDR